MMTPCAHRVWYPAGHTTLLRRWISVIDVDSTSQQRRVPSGMRRLAYECADEHYVIIQISITDQKALSALYLSELDLLWANQNVALSFNDPVKKINWIVVRALCLRCNSWHKKRWPNKHHVLSSTLVALHNVNMESRSRWRPSKHEPLYNVVLMLGQRRRRWANIWTPLFIGSCFPGREMSLYTEPPFNISDNNISGFDSGKGILPTQCTSVSSRTSASMWPPVVGGSIVGLASHVLPLIQLNVAQQLIQLSNFRWYTKSFEMLLITLLFK